MFGACAMARFLSLAEAVKSTVRDGDTVAMEGFTHLIPHAAGHEIIRQRKQRLTLIRMTPDLIYDQLIGMGCAQKVVFSWGGNPGVGSLHRLRDAVENGWPHPLAIEEHSHAAMANAYEAGAAGLPTGNSGLSFAERSEIPRLLREMIAHYSHYRARAQEKSSEWCDRLTPNVTLSELLNTKAEQSLVVSLNRAA